MIWAFKKIHCASAFSLVNPMLKILKKKYFPIKKCYCCPHLLKTNKNQKNTHHCCRKNIVVHIKIVRVSEFLVIKCVFPKKNIFYVWNSVADSDGSRYPKLGFWVLEVPWSNGLSANWANMFSIFFFNILPYLMIFF